MKITLCIYRGIYNRSIFVLGPDKTILSEKHRLKYNNTNEQIIKTIYGPTVTIKKIRPTLL